MGGGAKQNLRGKDGKIMTCHKCGSTDRPFDEKMSQG